VEKLNPSTGDQIAWNPVNSNPFAFLRIFDNAVQLSFATGIALDREGSIYVSGYEIANDNEVTSNAGDTTYVAFKIDSSANLLWHTYGLLYPDKGMAFRRPSVRSRSAPPEYSRG
jgi:hypothetical protein